MKPKIILQTLDVTTFEKNSDLYNPDQYLPYMLNNKEMKLMTYNGYPSFDYSIPMARYFGKKEAFIEILKLLLRPSGNKPVRIRGYHYNDLTWNNDLLKAQQELGSFEIKSDSAMILLFEKYLKECIQEKLKVVFVYSPEFIEGQKFVSNRSNILTLYYKFSKQYNIPFLDYSNDSMSFHKEYFYNSGHLNKKGSEIFTGKLIDDLRKSGLTDKLAP